MPLNKETKPNIRQNYFADSYHYDKLNTLYINMLFDIVSNINNCWQKNPILTQCILS